MAVYLLRSRPINVGETSPLAAVEFDAHADGSRVAALRHDAYSSRNDRWTDLAHFGDVRVTVAVKHLTDTSII